MEVTLGCAHLRVIAAIQLLPAVVLRPSVTSSWYFRGKATNSEYLYVKSLAFFIFYLEIIANAVVRRSRGALDFVKSFPGRGPTSARTGTCGGI